MTYVKDVKSLVATFEVLESPFSKELVLHDTKVIMHEKAIESVMSAKQLGIVQYSTFLDDRIVSNNNAPITDTIQKTAFLYSMIRKILS